MLERLFDRITKLSIRLKWVTLSLAVILIVAGVFAFMGLNQELIPKVDYPQSIILAIGGGMDADEILEEVTIPIENAMLEIEGVINIETTTSAGYSVSIVRSDFGSDQEQIRREIKKAIRKIDYPENMDIPEILNFSLSDLPIAIMSVSSEGATLDEVKFLVEEKIVPELEKLDEYVGEIVVSGGQNLPEGEKYEALLAGEDLTPEVEIPGDEDILLPQSWIDLYATYGDMVGEAEPKPGLLTPEIMGIIVGQANFLLEDLTPEMILLMQPEVVFLIPDEIFDNFDQESQDLIQEIFFSGSVFVPEHTINRSNGNPVLVC